MEVEWIIGRSDDFFFKESLTPWTKFQSIIKFNHKIGYSNLLLHMTSLFLLLFKYKISSSFYLA